ncbi:MAG: M48 family metallopeptidase [Campylobacterales bacterium]|nr:M48 family metallopeptidase [Campylobacterales bacterium]
MNFFEHQDRAKQKTTRLVLLFGLGVLALIVSVSAIVVFAFASMDANTAHLFQAYGARALLAPEVLILLEYVGAGVIAVVLLGMFFKNMQLKGGGKNVAESLGGKLLNPNTQDPNERRALNVVEEMAIASGIGVPPVYLLEEEGINAFAAGNTHHDAVVGLTRGCITHLNRDELQGVIAHEFSHIFHGDMRLNMRLVAWLYGIILIGLIGRIVFRLAASSGRSRGKNDNKAPLLIAGIGLMVAGYAGSFFGGLIRAAVSRQREYLADASAVQYTRNPAGIAGALKKIGASSHGAALKASGASEFSHLFFGEALPSSFLGLMATHPPLGDRIKRVDPRWDGSFTTPSRKPQDPKREKKLKERFGFGGKGVATAAVLGALGQVGEIHEYNIQDAQTLLGRLDPVLHEAAREPLLAKVLIYGLLQSKDPAIKVTQHALLEEKLGELHEVNNLLTRLATLEAQLILPLVELALPTLKTLSPSQQTTFKETLKKLIEADGKVSGLEWSLYTILSQSLKGQEPKSGHKTLLTCKAHAQVALSVLAHASDHDTAKAFAQAFEKLDVGPMELLKKTALRFRQLEHALEELSTLQPKHKQRLLEAMIICVGFDGVVSPGEIQLLKAMALSLGVALPPLIASA